MAIDFFEIGRGGASRTKKIDYSKALDPLAKKVETRVKESKAKTEALINSMPQGVAIDKVPEELRGQVTDFLVKNKQEYVDASRVIASGIRPTDQRYIDAMATINGVNNKFQNLSNQLEDIALKRQAALDGRDHSPGASDNQINDHESLANGSLYSTFTINDDGGFNYVSSSGENKKWINYSNTFQTSNAGQEAYFNLENNVISDASKGVEFSRNRYENAFRAVIKGLKNEGARDFVFSDEKFLESYTGFEFGTDDYDNAVKKLVNGNNFESVLKAFEKYSVDELSEVHKIPYNNYNNRQKAQTRGRKTENNQVSIEAARRGDKIIRIDEYNVAVKQENGFYKIAKNNEASLDLTAYPTSYNQADLIRLLGGKIDETADIRRFKKLEDTLNKSKPTEEEQPVA